MINKLKKLLDIMPHNSEYDILDGDNAYSVSHDEVQRWITRLENSEEMNWAAVMRVANIMYKRLCDDGLNFTLHTVPITAKTRKLAVTWSIDAAKVLQVHGIDAEVEMAKYLQETIDAEILKSLTEVIYTGSKNDA